MNELNQIHKDKTFSRTRRSGKIARLRSWGIQTSTLACVLNDLKNAVSTVKFSVSWSAFCDVIIVFKFPCTCAHPARVDFCRPIASLSSNQQFSSLGSLCDRSSSVRQKFVRQSCVWVIVMLLVSEIFHCDERTAVSYREIILSYDTSL
jgi:hypothetical protein